MSREPGLTEAPYQRPNDPTHEILVDAGDSPEEAVVLVESSLRSKRKIFTWSITAFMLGVLLILLSSPYRSEFIAPGVFLPLMLRS